MQNDESIAVKIQHTLIKIAVSEVACSSRKFEITPVLSKLIS